MPPSIFRCRRPYLDVVVRVLLPSVCRCRRLYPAVVGRSLLLNNLVREFITKIRKTDDDIEKQTRQQDTDDNIEIRMTASKNGRPHQKTANSDRLPPDMFLWRAEAEKSAFLLPNVLPSFKRAFFVVHGVSLLATLDVI